MKIFFLILGFCITSTAIANRNGSPVNLEFINLTPGAPVSLEISGGMWIAPIQGAPHDLHYDHGHLSFTAPAQPQPGRHLVSVRFVMGAILPEEITFNFGSPEPAAVFVQLAEATNTATILYSQQNSHVTISAPSMFDNCYLAGAVPDPQCPIMPERPLRPFGPRNNTFYCCHGTPEVEDHHVRHKAKARH